MTTLYRGDCLNLLATISNSSIDLIITDPPYGVNFSKGFDDTKESVKQNIQQWLNELYRVLKDNSHCYIFVPVKEIDMWVNGVKTAGFEFKNLLATKTYTQNQYLCDNFSFNMQPVIFCAKGKRILNKVDFIPTSTSWMKDKRNKNPHPYTYQYPAFLPLFSNTKTTSKINNNNGRHPCSKSPDFIEVLIKLSSNEGDTVLDPFMGGGATGIAALRCHRNFIGAELNDTYFEQAKTALSNTK